jgi:hypothetical protein
MPHKLCTPLGFGQCSWAGPEALHYCVSKPSAAPNPLPSKSPYCRLAPMRANFVPPPEPTHSSGKPVAVKSGVCIVSSGVAPNPSSPQFALDTIELITWHFVRWHVWHAFTISGKHATFQEISPPIVECLMTAEGGRIS